ncbi:MAG: DUF5719 family protein [Actinomycetota bacterium]
MRKKPFSVRRDVPAGLYLLLSLLVVLALMPLMGTPAAAASVKMPVYARVIGGQGTVSPTTQWVKWGHSATINIYPGIGYEVDDIIDNGESKGAQSPYVISSVHVPHLVLVDFSPAVFGIDASVSGGHGEVYPTHQTVGYDDAATIDLIPDNGYHIASIKDNGVSQPITDPYGWDHVTSYHNVVVTYAMDTYTVTASVSGGHGTVQPPVQTVDYGDDASVSITPDPGYEISSISDNGVVQPVSNPYVMNDVTANHDVVVTFALRQYTVDASVSGGNGTVSPATQDVGWGETASIDITPDPGYHTATITDNGSPAPVADPYVINNVTADHDVVVTFTTNTYPVNAGVVGGHGTVSPATQTVADGGTASIDITPDAGYEIATITDNGVSMPLSDPYVITGIHEQHDVSVTFSRIELTVTAVVAGGNGSVNPASQTVEYGQTAAIDITPDPGYHIASITDNGQPATIADPYYINDVTADHNVVVSFALNQYTVDASVSGGNGQVAPLTQNVLDGGIASVNITPDGGYQTATIIDNGVAMPLSNPYDINNVHEDHTVVVTFKASDYMVAAMAAGGHGTVNPTTQVVTLHGNSVPIVITPDAGYHVATVTDNGVPQAPVSPYQVLDVTADHAVVATFALNEYQVDASVQGGHGSVDPPAQTVSQGGNAVIDITPDTGYEIETITDNGAFVPVSNPYTIVGVTENHDVVVTFDIQEFAVTAAVAGGNGAVNPASQIIDYGGAASIDIIPDPGYHTASIVDNGSPAPVSDPYVIQNVTAAHNVVVSFSTNTYPVDASVEGGGGTVDPPTQTVADGATASVDINPDTGYDIATVTDNGVHMPISNPYVITGVHEEHDVVVTFTLHEFTVTAVAGDPNGTVSPPVQTVGYGGTATVDIIPDPGYHVVSITDNGSPAPIADPYIINNVTADHNVVVTFELNTYTVDATVVGGNGSVAPGTQDVAWGGTAAVNIVPDTGYHIASIADNGEFVSIENPYIIQNVICDHQVAVTFAIDMETVKANVIGGHGTVQPAEQSVPYGDNAVITLDADTGYHPYLVVDNGDPKPVADPYVIDDVTTDHNVSVTFDYDTSPTYYLAEGSTAWGFSAWICIENPNTEALNAKLTYMLAGGGTLEQTVGLPALSQVTVNPADTVGAADFSTVVSCVQGKTIAVDRTMTWTGAGAPSPESHCSVGVDAPGQTWYLPEGCSDFGFETWTLVANPNDSDANVTLIYMTEDAGPVSVDTVVPAHSRATNSMLSDIGPHNASITVTSDRPVVAERSMYRNNRREGSCSLATDDPSETFYLAEGSTAWGFASYVLVQNPNPDEATVTLTCMTPAGRQVLDSFDVAPQSRKTLHMNSLIPDTDFSTVVTSDSPIVAERAMYWGAGTPLGEACHDSVGLAEPHGVFYLADGRTSGGWETYTLVANPNDSDVQVMVTYLYEGGGSLSYTIATVPAHSRVTFDMGAQVASGNASIEVKCLTEGKKIIAERSMYWNNRGAGTDTVGDWSH